MINYDFDLSIASNINVKTEWRRNTIDELEAFNYEEYKKNGFKVNKLGDYDLVLEDKPE